MERYLISPWELKLYNLVKRQKLMRRFHYSRNANNIMFGEAAGHGKQ